MEGATWKMEVVQGECSVAMDLLRLLEKKTRRTSVALWKEIVGAQGREDYDLRPAFEKLGYVEGVRAWAEQSELGEAYWTRNRN